MELDAEERAGARLGDDALRPGGRGRRLDRVGVCEVVGGPVDLGPADSRHPALAEAERLSGKQTEAVDAAVFLRPLDRELEPEADAEHRLSVADAPAQLVVEPLPA